MAGYCCYMTFVYLILIIIYPVVTSYYIPVYINIFSLFFLIVDEAATEEGLDMFKSKGKST